ncbi:MAG: glutathione S-transferase family protein [Pseudomonadales bacterium]|nr:glutathione S-transferase family protein [Pseudomonadales bacterium]
MSNYYSLVKAVLIEKGLEFEEIKAPPTQKEDNLARSPMGKMPSIEVDGVYLSESLAIVNYLERIQPEPSLLPADPVEAAKAIELALHIKLNVELAARRLLPAAMFGGTASEELIESTRQEVLRGMQAVSALLVCKPYAAGDSFTIADMYLNYSMGLATSISTKMFDHDLLADYPQVSELLSMLAERPSIARVTQEAASK